MADSEMHELMVRVRPDGVSETQEELDGMSETFQETADETEEAAGLLQEYAEQFRGAANVVIAGLGVAAGGLLAQIPVISEALGGLFSIFDAFLLRIDENLRPSLGGLSTAFYDVADGIVTADGKLGLIMDVLAIATPVFLTGALAVGAYAAATAFAATTTGALLIALSPIVGILAGIAILVGALAVAWRENFLDIKSLTLAFIENVLEGRWKDAFGNWLQLNENVLNLILDGFIWFFGEVAKIGAHGWNKFIALSETFISRFRTGVEGLFALLVREAKSWANKFAGIIEGGVNRVLGAIPADVLQEAGLPTSVSVSQPFSNVGSRRDVLQEVGERGRRREQQIEARARQRGRDIEKEIEKLVAALQSQDIEIPLSLDSKEVAKETEKYAGNSARNAGAGRFVR